jgi:hypothetical protein
MGGEPADGAATADQSIGSRRIVDPRLTRHLPQMSPPRRTMAVRRPVRL